MRRLHLQNIVVVLAIIVASCQCSMACAVDPCQDSATSQSSEQAPPCHQHHQGDESKAPQQQGCAHTQFVVDQRASVAPAAPEFVQLWAAILPPQSALTVDLNAHQKEIAHQVLTPPVPDLVLSTVLRV